MANGGNAWLEDAVFALVLAVGPGSVTLSSGSNSVTQAVSGGVNYVKCPLQTGSVVSVKAAAPLVPIR